MPCRTTQGLKQMGLTKTAKKKSMGPLDIDDPRDLFNQQVDAMTRPNPEFRGGAHVWVFYVGPLTPKWDEYCWAPSSATVAVAAVDRALESKVDWAVLRRIAHQIDRIDENTSNDDVKTLLGRAIVGRQLRVIRKNNRMPAGKADPAVFAELNGQYGTLVNFAYLAQWEGGQLLHGYVPYSGKRVAGASGVTIATGFDIGQKSAGQMDKLGIEPTLLAKLSPFAGHRLKHPGKNGLSFTQAEVMAVLTSIGAPVPTITKTQADLLDKLIHGEHLAAAKNAWNNAKQANVPSFTQLPAPWQTVMFSRFFHQGMGAHTTPQMHLFWTSATAGEWDAAATALANYPVSQAWYKTRVKQEATYLRTQMPPEVVKPKPKKTGVPARAAASPPRPGH